MQGNLFRSSCYALGTAALACLVVFLSGCGTQTALWGPTTSVAPLASEDLAKPCQYELQIVGENVPQAGVLVIFERGDSLKLFEDAKLQAMAAQLHLAMMFAYQCDAASFNDIQADATKGPGRALFQALTQFATITTHTELAKANVILFGFSAGGALTATMVNNYPNRVLGAIPYATGSAYYDINTTAVTPGAAKVPVLVLANAFDPASGTQWSFNFFERGWEQGAPWGFAVQNGTGHCCTLSVRDLLIPWVTAVMQTQTVAGANGLATLRGQTSAAAPTVRFLCLADGHLDAQGETDCSIYSASILPSTAGGPLAAWLPDATTTDAWFKWVISPGTN